MEEPPHAWKSSHGRAQTGKVLEQVDVVEKSSSKLPGGSWMLLPRPGNDFFEVS